MKNPLPVILAIIGVGLLLSNWEREESPSPDAPRGPDMVRAFRARRESRRNAREDALRLAALSRAIRGQLEHDWRQEKPLIRTGVEADNLRLFARGVLTGGESLAADYPDLPGVLAEHFSDYVGSSGGPLDESRKHKWLAAWESLGAACDYAAREL